MWVLTDTCVLFGIGVVFNMFAIEPYPAKATAGGQKNENEMKD